MADGGPEDEVIASIWSSKSKHRLPTVRIGEVDHSVTEAIVWFPYLIVVVTGWIGLVALLPADLAGDFLGFTSGWLAIFSGDLSTTIWVSLIADIMALLIVFFVYTKVYGAVIGWLLGITGESASQE